jgi:hypothetical protein
VPATTAPVDSTPTTTLIGEPDGGCRVGTWPDCTPPPTNGGGTLPATGPVEVALWLLVAAVAVGLGGAIRHFNRRQP